MRHNLDTQSQRQTPLPEEFFRSHITFTSVAEITEIARPLSNIGLTYFTFDRHYNDGSRICLTNAGKWIEHYWRSGLYQAAVFEKDPMNFFNGYVFWDWLNREPIYSAASEHDIDHGVTITEINTQYSDFFHFGTNRHNNLPHDGIIKMMDSLHHFIAYFKQRMRKLITQAAAQKNEFPVYGEERKLIRPSDLNDQMNQGSLEEFLKDTSITRLYLGEQFNDAYLTRQEIHVLSEVIRKTNFGDAAKAIGMSRRTFNYHIDNAKKKLQANNLVQLGYAIKTIDAKNIYPFKIY